jgi:hypothetical protein
MLKGFAFNIKWIQSFNVEKASVLKGFAFNIKGFRPFNVEGFCLQYKRASIQSFNVEGFCLQYKRLQSFDAEGFNVEGFFQWAVGLTKPMNIKGASILQTFNVEGFCLEYKRRFNPSILQWCDGVMVKIQ